MEDEVSAGMPAERRILNAAREVFAKKGYEGASISEIAKKAGVNKALPFYYFKSKENLLKEVVQLGARDTIERRQVFMRSSKDPWAKDSMEEYFVLVLEAMESRKEIVKILLMEALKDSDEGTLLFQFMDPIVGETLDKFKKLGIPVENPERLKSSELFFNAVPLFMFTVLYKKWARYHQWEDEKVKSDFFEAFKDIYMDFYYKKYFENTKNKGGVF